MGARLRDFFCRLSVSLLEILLAPNTFQTSMQHIFNIELQIEEYKEVENSDNQEDLSVFKVSVLYIASSRVTWRDPI